MSQQVHILQTPNGKVYRVWSDNSNQYASDNLTLDELRLFNNLMQIDAALFSLFSDPELSELHFNEWVQRGEALEKWEEESERIPASKENAQWHKEVVQRKKDFLLQAYKIWEKFSFEGKV